MTLVQPDWINRVDLDGLLLILKGFFILNLNSQKFDVGIENILLIDGHDLFEPNLEIAQIVDFDIALFVLEIQV